MKIFRRGEMQTLEPENSPHAVPSLNLNTTFSPPADNNGINAVATTRTAAFHEQHKPATKQGVRELRNANFPPRISHDPTSCLSGLPISTLFQSTSRSIYQECINTPWGKLKNFLLSYFETRKSDSPYEAAAMPLGSWITDLGYSRPYIPKHRLAKYEIHYDTKSSQWFYLHSGKAVGEAIRFLMVMSPKGNLYIMENERGTFNHSSFLMGRRIGAGGYVSFDRKSQIRESSDRTGHYWQGFKDVETNWKQFLVECLRRGANMEGVTIFHEARPNSRTTVTNKLIEALKREYSSLL